jgi:hypothetical protein
MSEEIEIPEEVKQQYYSIRIYQKEAAGKKNYLETEKKKLEDGRYGSKIRLKPQGKASMLSMYLNCKTKNGIDIIDAEVEMEPKPTSLHQYYVHHRIAPDGKEHDKMVIGWQSLIKSDQQNLTY